MRRLPDGELPQSQCHPACPDCHFGAQPRWHGAAQCQFEGLVRGHELRSGGWRLHAGHYVRGTRAAARDQSRLQRPHRRHRAMRTIRMRGFTLTELAVVLTIVAILLSSLMWTLSAQSDQRSRDDTQRKLDQAKELLLAFAVANGRLPCPARCSNFPACNAAGDGGDEMPAAGLPMPAGGSACSDNYTGYLPGRAIGFQPTDANGYAIDAWGNRI